MLIKQEWLGYRTVKNYDHYVKPFSSDTGTLRTDGWTNRRTDGRTDRFAISISRVSTLTRNKNSRVRRIHMLKPTVQQYQQCCHFANGNKTCSLLLFKNNNVARESQGFVRQSSRNVALHVEQPSVLNKFFFRITIWTPAYAERASIKRENTFVKTMQWCKHNKITDNKYSTLRYH